jgi:acetyl esterase/lipase
MTTTIMYGSHPDQVVELHEPEGDPTGLLVVIVHGGDWRVEADRGYLAPMAAALAAEGHAVALAEFRRLGGGGGWPQTSGDVAAAVTAAAADTSTRAQARACVIVGHSAGGQLALWAAAQPPALALPLRGVVALDPVADLALAHERGSESVAELLGGTPAEVPDAFAAADPARLAPRVPVRVLAAAGDPMVPPALARSYAAAHGAAVDLRVLDGDSHFTFTSPGAANWRETVAAVAAFQQERP